MVDPSPAAQAAAQWWTDRIRGPVTHDNGDRSFNGFFATAVGGMIADRHPTPEGEQFDRFQRLLAEHIDTLLDAHSSRYISIGCDYGPDRHLADVAEVCGIPLSRFPWKVNQSVHATHIVVSDGYAAPWVLAWSAEDWDRPTCGSQEWVADDENEYGGDYADRKCGLPVYHEGEHGDWVPSPRCALCQRPEQSHWSGMDHEYTAPEEAPT